jgi:hypothetical protein
METPPLVDALARAKETGFTGALILRRPGGESYTVTVVAGAPTLVEPGPDDVPVGTTLFLIDRVRQSVLTEDLSAEESRDPAAAAKLALRRIARILRLPGECMIEAARVVAEPVAPVHVAPVSVPPVSVPPLSLPPRVESVGPRVAIPESPPTGGRPANRHSTDAPPSVRPRVSIPLPGGGSAALDAYAGRRVSVPANLPPRIRTPLPPSNRPPAVSTPMPPSNRAHPHDGTPLSARPPGTTTQSGFRRVSLPASVPPPPLVTSPSGQTMALSLESAKARVAQMDFAGADRILRDMPETRAANAETVALTAWVQANLDGNHERPLELLNVVLQANPTCEHALYYRGLVLKRAGERKAALRDFVTLAKQNPHHGPALSEIKALRTSMGE